MSETREDTMVRDRSRPPRQNGQAIRSLREKDGYTQRAFAQAIGMKPANLCNIENETHSARVPTLNKIARQLRVPVAAIMRELAAEDAAA